MINKVAFTGFNNVTLTNMNLKYSDGEKKSYKRLCVQLNDNDGMDLSQNSNLLKRFPDKMRSNYLRIDSSSDCFLINGKKVEFYGENGSLFKQIGDLLTKIGNHRYDLTYTKNYLKSSKLFDNMTCCFKGLKLKKVDLKDLKKESSKVFGDVTDKKSIAEFTGDLSKVCYDFNKVSKLLS